MDTRHRIGTFFQRGEIARSLITLGESVGGLARLAVVGGALRELVFAELCATIPQIPDIDVAVLVDFDRSEAVKQLGERACSVNSFGGIRWRNGWIVPLDIWPVRAWAERIGKPSRSEYGVDEIKSFLDFNVNAGIFSPCGSELDIVHIQESVTSRTLELHNSLVPPNSVQLARIIKLERRVSECGLELGPEIRRYVIKVIESLDSTSFLVAKAYFERKSGYQAGAAGAYFDARIAQLAAESDCNLGKRSR